jgi:hypothetical protein
LAFFVDPGWKKVGSMIRYKHPGSATLPFYVATNFTKFTIKDSGHFPDPGSMGQKYTRYRIRL